MSFLFDRIAKVIIGTSDTEALAFDERFRITFSITKTNVSTPTLSTINIYNLSKTDRSNMEGIPDENLKRSGEQIPPLDMLLYAGYKEGAGYELLYNGNITSVNTNYEPPNYITRILCGDGLKPLNNTTLQLSFAAGIGTNQIINQIASALKMDISKASDYLTHNIAFAKGYSFSGLAKTAMDEITKEAGLKWHVEKGQLIITSIDKPSKDVLIELNAKSGLIGIPARSTNNQIGDLYNSGDYQGWNIKALLQPSIIPSRQIHVTSKEVTGTFLIDSVAHKGDTRSGDWVSEIETRAKGLGGL